MNPYQNEDLRSLIESLSPEVIKENQRLQEEENIKLYSEFTDALKENKCFLCNEHMDTFDPSNPCFHWFTYPKEIRKKHFESYLSEPISFFQLDCYFRWLANSENPLGNINDLKEETSKASYIETTIKYKNIEWAFSLGHTDMEGHKGGKVGATPHYHLQMIVDGRIFLKFNDFHIQFTDEDLFNFSLIEQAPDLVEFSPSFGQGIGILEDERNLEAIDSIMVLADDPDTAPINRQTLITAEEGKTIPGELIQRAILESQSTKEPVGRIMQRLLKELESNASVITVLTAGDGVPEMKKRSGKK